jgi:molybdenum-dependent DNA-binding transcriptional regulator ModE
VRRPVVEQPSRHIGLLVDATVVPSAFALDLAAMLAARHTARAHRRRGHPVEVTVPPAPAPRSLRPGAVDESNGERPGPPGELDNVDLESLRAVAEHGSINRAATVLSLSQLPALIRRVGRLEHRLGARLFVRTAQGTRLTGPVQQFLRRLAELEDELGSARAGDHRTSCRPAAPMRRIPSAG